MTPAHARGSRGSDQLGASASRASAHFRLSTSATDAPIGRTLPGSLSLFLDNGSNLSLDKSLLEGGRA